MKRRRYAFLIIVFLAFVYSDIPKAQVLDGGEIQFYGYVTDEAPKWTWQIASPGQKWGVDIAEARLDGDNLVFNLNNKGVLPFLEGRLHEIAERGGPGFIPYISFSSDGAPLTISDNENMSSQKFRASIPVRDSENSRVVGKLNFTLEQAMAISVGNQSQAQNIHQGMSLISGDTVKNVQPSSLSSLLKNKLSSLLMMNKGFGNGMNAVINSYVLNQQVLSDGRVTNIAAAYASNISDFELYLPAEGTPSNWQARLNVSVTVQ